MGLDVSRTQLERAKADAYDDWVVADARDWVPSLEGQFDLVVSFQVLEHVKPLGAALENIRRYLLPGGALVAQLSGAFSLFGLANRVIPHQVTVWLLERLLSRPPDTVFPAHYDHAWWSALRGLLAGWSSATVTPEWWGAGYFSFSRVLQAGYIAYEEWTRLADRPNLAPYYVLEAVR